MYLIKMITLDYINILSLIDFDIIINEKVNSDVYEYVKNIVEKYSNYSIVIYLQLTISDNIIYIKVYEK